jgi:flavin reductase (DIM6/NTAB) family NADH-FMN oxidoreductase RutF
MLIMKKLKVPLTAYSEETIRTLNRCGCLLVSGKMKKANVMTIGWGLIGILWGKPFFMVAVRPSRHTHDFIEEIGDFTVNIPKKGMESIVNYCGSVSGREHDKFKEKGLTLVPGKKVKSPIISECIINYECKVAFKSKVIPNELQRNFIKKYYSSGDYHTLYFGEILATFADEDVASHLV